MTDDPRLPRLPPLPDDATQETVEAAVPRPEPDPAPDQDLEPAADERRLRRRVVDGRRLQSAGHGLLVAFLALTIGALLNAPGIYKSAYNQQDGWQRDVALAVTGPLADVSAALRIDEPRAALKSALGRSDDDTIETVVVVAPPKAIKPKPIGKTTFTPQKKLRLWVAGDSLIVTPGSSILGAAGGSPVMEPLGGVDGRIATGLERPDVFNWFTHVSEQMKELKPDVVVFGFGGNDDHGYMTGLPEAITQVDGFGLPVWEREYRRRVGALMDTVNRAGGYVVWVGLPITRDAEQSRRFDVLNSIYQTEARKRPRGATYVDTYVTFADDSGGFSEYLPDGAGRLVKMRAADGVHFERAGGDVIARTVLKRLNERFDLTSWRQQAEAP